ncbi:MAG: hypothetical protein Q9172_000353 [Xanthocarpia lactea]
MGSEKNSSSISEPLPGKTYLLRALFADLTMLQQNVKIIGGDWPIWKWITSVRYGYAAQSVHNEAYTQGGRKPYAIPARRRYHVCVSSQHLVEELTQASIRQLSLRHALFDIRWLDDNEVHDGNTERQQAPGCLGQTAP